MEKFIEKLKNLSPGESFIYGNSKSEGNVSSGNKVVKFKYEKSGRYHLYLLIDGGIQKTINFEKNEFDKACEKFVEYVSEQWNT